MARRGPGQRGALAHDVSGGADGTDAGVLGLLHGVCRRGLRARLHLRGKPNAFHTALLASDLLFRRANYAALSPHLTLADSPPPSHFLSCRRQVFGSTCSVSTMLFIPGLLLLNESGPWRHRAYRSAVLCGCRHSFGGRRRRAVGVAMLGGGLLTCGLSLALRAGVV